MDKSHRNIASFGKRQEYSVMAELLKRGFDIYPTLVDDKGIDCIIRLDERRYIDIQIKARSKDAKQWSLFAGMSYEPRNSYYFIFYTEKNGNFWVIPSIELEELCSINKSGMNKGKKNLSIPIKDVGKRAERFARYKNEKGFELIQKFGRRKQMSER